MIEIPNEWRRCCKARNGRLCLERERNADAPPMLVSGSIRTRALVRDSRA
ncbi:hypothetical protein [Burkholderia sp. ABCPW 14]|nr:hypothetical protein [Burkholderia sp. ABCPW 14]